MAGGKTNLTPFMQVGLFVWQTRIANNPQNDAFLYSAGLDLRRGKLRAKTSAGGYYGYFGEGDRPLVYRLGLWYEPSARHSLGCQWQEGLRDFEYTSIRISYSYQLSKETEQRHSSGNDQP